MLSLPSAGAGAAAGETLCAALAELLARPRQPPPVPGAGPMDLDITATLGQLQLGACCGGSDSAVSAAMRGVGLLTAALCGSP